MKIMPSPIFSTPPSQVMVKKKKHCREYRGMGFDPRPKRFKHDICRKAIAMAQLICIPDSSSRKETKNQKWVSKMDQKLEL